MVTKDFEHPARDLVASFGRLVRVCDSADGDAIPVRDASQLFGECAAIPLFGEDPGLEVVAIAKFHKLVRVARVAVFAAVFAASIRV